MIPEMSVLVLTVIICCVVFAWSWLRPRHRSPPVYPGSLPLIGHAHLFIGDRKNLWNLVRRIQMYSLETGGVCEIRFGTHSAYVLTDPEDVLTLANSCLSKPYIYDFANDYVINGLITAKVSVWKTHRKLLNPAFNQQVLNTYINDMNLQARSLVSKLASKAGKDPFDIQNYFISHSLSTVTSTSLRLNTEDQTKIDTDYAEATADLLALFCDRLQKVWLHPSFIFNWSAMKCKQNKLINNLKSIMNPIIHKRKSELMANKNQTMYNDTEPDKSTPLLDQMLNLADEQDAFTNDDIREHLDTLVAAAYDTTTSALTFTLLVVGSDRNIQERIFNELQEVLPHKDDDLTKQDLQRLVYLEAVIKETLRLYPVVPIIARNVDIEVKLKNFTLRAGSTCGIGLYGLLRHPMWGADAEQFRPERWLDPATLPKHPGLHAAFGVGKRNCIGKLYAMMVMKTALAHIFRRYQVTGDIHNVVFEVVTASKPVEGHLIGLTLRT